MASRVAGKIKLQSVDELLGVPEIAGTQEIEIERIHAFPNHPFKVLDDEKMDTLVDSIRENGILNPVHPQWLWPAPLWGAAHRPGVCRPLH